MTKTSRENFDYAENEEGFYDEIKSIFYHFEGL